MNKSSMEISRWRDQQGFYTPSTLESEGERDAMLVKLMLVVTEVSEAAEAVRHKDWNNFKEEIADAMIRLLDISGSIGIDIELEVSRKMGINKRRPFRHGKSTSL